MAEERLQKIIAAAGLCSRRMAEEWIAARRVCCNGTVAKTGQKADPQTDTITVDGNPITVKNTHHYYALNKPRGYVSTLRDEHKRKTVAELMADCGTRVNPVGRLDMDSEGLLLFTDDGEWLQSVLHPKFEVSKEYHVTIAGDLKDAEERLSSIMELDGEPIAPAKVKWLRTGRDVGVVSITIHQGKNRQIRRMCAQVGLFVKRLCRVREGCVRLGNLPEGKWRELTETERIGLVNPAGKEPVKSKGE